MLPNPVRRRRKLRAITIDANTFRSQPGELFTCLENRSRDVRIRACAPHRSLKDRPFGWLKRTDQSRGSKISSCFHTLRLQERRPSRQSFRLSTRQTVTHALQGGSRHSPSIGGGMTSDRSLDGVVQTSSNYLSARNGTRTSSLIGRSDLNPTWNRRERAAEGFVFVTP